MSGSGKRTFSGGVTRAARRIRRAAFVIAVVFGLSVAVPAGAVPRGGDFPLAWLWSWTREVPGWSAAAFAGLPEQRQGQPIGDHYVPSSVTRANGGAGRNSTPAPGALPPEADRKLDARPSTTPPLAGGHSFDPVRSTRVASGADAMSDVFANPDGSHTRNVYGSNVNFRATDGTWKPIDRRLVKGADGRFHQAANPVDISFSEDAAAGNVAALELNGRSVAYSMVGARPSKAEVAGNTATYRGVGRGVDLTLSATPAGLKESLILHSPDVPTSWLFRLELKGLTAAIGPDGSVEFRDSTGGVAATVPPGYMDDSKFDSQTGGFVRSRGVSYELTTVDDGPALRVSVDGAWLRDPARVFPVTVDPTTSPVSTADDTYVKSGATGNNSGDTELLVGTFNGGANKHRSFMHFGGFAADYGGSRITAAYLKAFNTWSWNCDPHPFAVHAVTAGWIGSTTTTHPGPSVGGAIGSVTASPGPACTNTGGNLNVGVWMTVPLGIATLQSWATNGATNNGLAIIASETNNNQWKRFVSRNSSSGNAPYLQITYAPNVAPQVNRQYPPAGYTSSTLTPELLVNAHDPDAHPNPLQYLFQVYDKTATKVAESGWVVPPSWTVPSSANLRWGETYTWTVIASDGHKGSTSQNINVFSTSAPQPLVTAGLSQNGGRGYDPSIGNYTTSATDAAVATVGPALAIQRSYNSLDSRTGSAFGAGWSSVLDAKATVDPGVPNVVVIRYPTGQEVAFGRHADGTFVPPAGRFATFTSVTGGGYRLVDKDGTAYAFTAAGSPGVWHISSITDASGRALTFTYSSAGKASQITSVSGRSLFLTWSAAVPLRVQSVSTDPVVSGNPSTALTWTYGYAGELLTSLCSPTSATACTTYAYGSGSQYANAVLNAGPRSYWRLNDASGTVADSSVDSYLGTDNGTYVDATLGQSGPLPAGVSKAAGFNGTSSRVQLPTNLLPSASFKSVSLWFKANPGDQGVLFSYTVDPLTNATTAGGYVPSLYVGTSGKLWGAFWPVPQISTAASVADGTWHHATLTAGGGSQSLYLDGNLVGTAAGSPADFGQRYSTIGAGFQGSIWQDSPYTGGAVQRSFFKGSIAEVAMFERPLQQAEVTALKTAAGTARPLTSVLRPSGNPSVIVAYDAVSGRVSQVTDQNGGLWKVSAPATSGSSQVYVGSVLSAGPADYWRLAERDTVDAVNQVNGGIATYSDVTLGVSGGPFDDATTASFNGTSSYLKLPAADVPATGPTSISMWFKMPAGNAAGGVLFGYEGAGGWTPALYVGTDGKLRGHFWIGDTAKIVVTPGPVNDGNWHHVTLAASTNSQSLYLDGVRVGAAVNGTLVAFGASDAYVGKGRWDGWPAFGAGTHGVWPGHISEVAFFRSQLSDVQVAAQFVARDKASGIPVKTVTVTDPGNKTMTHVYSLATGRQVAETDTLGNKTQFGYDTGGFLRTVTDPNGNVTTTEHDVRGNTVSSKTCQDQSAQLCSTNYFTYFPDATTKILTPDPRNDVMLTMRDGRSASAADNTYLTTFAYDANGNRISVTDPLGRVTTTLYTDGTTIAAADGGFAPRGLPRTVITPGGALQAVVYHQSGDVAQVTDPVGMVTTLTYDRLGRALTKTEATTTFPTGITTAFGYDGLGRLVSQTDPAITNRVTGAVHTAVTATVYDVDGLATSQTMSDTTGGDAPRTVSSTYNARGQQVTSTDATNKTTTLAYDLYGNVVRETGSDAGVSATAYDAEGRILTSTLVGYTGDPNNPSPATDTVLESRAYDPAGRLALVTDAMGWTTAYTYTDNGLTATVTRRDPTTGAQFVQENNTYDAGGNNVKQIANDSVTTMTSIVDAAGRTMSSTLDPVGLNRKTTYEYSRDDRVIGTMVTDGAGAVVSRSDTMHDPLGRVLANAVHNGINPPVLRWRLNETSGSKAFDSAGNANGSLTNATWTTDPVRGPVASFNGTNAIISNAEAVVNTAKPYTFATWVKMNDKATNQWVMIATGNSGSSAIKLFYEKTLDSWSVNIGNRTADGGTAWLVFSSPGGLPQSGVWTHLAVTVDPASRTAKLYVDGTQHGAGTGSVAFTNQAKSFQIGAEFGANRLNGSMSDVQMYQHVLLPTAIGQIISGAAPAAGARVVRTSAQIDSGGLTTAAIEPNGHTTNYQYDEAGRVVVSTAPSAPTETEGGTPVMARPVSSVGYDTFGAQTQTKDSNGNVTTAAYDAAGRVVSSTLPGYTPPGSSTPIIATASRTYDVGGQLATSTDPLGKTTTYAYDQFGRVAKVVAPNLGETRYTYDLLGDPLSVTDPTGAVNTATYDYLGRKRTSTQVVRQDSTNHTTNYAYGAGGWLSSVQAPTGATTSTTYNAAGETLTVRDAANNTTTSQYNAAGRMVRTTLPDGSYTSATYDMAGRQTATTQHGAPAIVATSVVDRVAEVAASAQNTPGGEVATNVIDGNVNTKWLAFNPFGWLRFRMSEVVAVTRYTLTSANDVYERDPRDWTLQGSQDGVSWTTVDTQTDQSFTERRQTKTYEFANSTAYLYYRLDVSQVVSAPMIQLAEVGLWKTTATPAGAPLASTGAAYDASGNVVAATDARGSTTTLTYDAVGSLTAETQPINGSDSITTSFGYDLARNRTRFTDGRGNAFITKYNKWNLPEARIEPATTAYPNAADRTFTVVYDAGGRQASIQSPGGVTVTNSYDDMGRVIGQTGVGAEVSTTGRAFGYDPAGRLTSFSGPGGPNTLTYDDRGLLRSTGGGSGVASFTYNPDGAMASRTDSAGTTSYGYDSAGRLSTVANPTSAVQLTLGYNNLSQATSIAYGGGGGNSRAFSYDGLHRLTKDELRTHVGSPIASISYGYDANGNETSKTTAGFAAATTNGYTYDLANRLTSWDNGSVTAVYAYDKSGNRVQSGARLFGYDQRNQLSTVDSTAYSYTARGTLASGGSIATQTDAFGQVITQQPLGGGTAEVYEYDALGRYLRPGFAYTGVGNDLAGDGNATYTRGTDGGLLGAAGVGGQRLAWTDLHTDVVGEFTATGTALTGSMAYDPLGKALAGSGMVGFLGFQSEWTNNATGRLNMHARWYNVETGQFDTRDSAELSPVPNSVAANRFAYADDNPLTVTDPTGHWSLRSSLSSAWNSTRSAASNAWNATTSFVSNTWNSVRSTVSSAYNEARELYRDARALVAQKVAQAKKFVAQKVNQVKQTVKKAYHKAKQIGRAVVAKTVRVVKAQINLVKDVYKATEQWVKDHKDLLIEIAAVGIGILAGLACTAATAGAGAVACMVGAAALVNLAKDAAQGNIHNWGDAFGSLGTGALSGLMGGVGGVVGGRIAGALAGKLGGLAATVGGRVFGGAVSGAVGDIVAQVGTTGRVDWGGVAMSAGIGGVFGGRAPKRPGVPTNKAPSRDAADNTPNPPSGCRTHSFDPDTKVLMADGSNRPIKDVNVGDTVVATEPGTGQSSARPVTALHINRDTDLTDVTLTDTQAGPGRTATLKTTARHPFWNDTTKTWVYAAELKPGHRLRTPSGDTETVTAVTNRTQPATMRDLTIAQVHTYYVLAGSTPVLVHNCGGALSNAYYEAKRLTNVPRAWLDNRALSSRLGGESPAPNATVRDLLGFRPGNPQRPEKLVNANARSDDDLLNSVFSPADNQFIATNASMPNTILQGNHRVFQLLQRAADPENAQITWDTPIFINRGDW